VQPWNLVDDECEDRRHSKCIGRDGNDVCELDVQLFPVMRNPAALVEASVYTIETNDVASTEDAICKKTDHTSDAVFSEDVESIVDTDPEFN